MGWFKEVMGRITRYTYSPFECITLAFEKTYQPFAYCFFGGTSTTCLHPFHLSLDFILTNLDEGKLPNMFAGVLHDTLGPTNPAGSLGVLAAFGFASIAADAVRCADGLLRDCL